MNSPQRSQIAGAIMQDESRSAIDPVRRTIGRQLLIAQLTGDSLLLSRDDRVLTAHGRPKFASHA